MWVFFFFYCLTLLKNSLNAAYFFPIQARGLFPWNRWNISRPMVSPFSVNQYPGLQIRVHNWKLFFLFVNQNVCSGYSKELSRRDGSFEHPQQMFKLMDKKIIAIVCKLFLLNWPYEYLPIILLKNCSCQLLIVFFNIFKTNTKCVPLWPDQLLNFGQIFLFSIDIISEKETKHIFNMEFTFKFNMFSVVHRSRHCRISRILKSMSLKNAPSAGQRMYL